MFLSSEIKNNCNTTLLQKGFQDVEIIQLAIDSRKIIQAANTLFFALKTSNRNGHDFISSCYHLGVRHFVITDEVNFKNYPEAWFWKSENTLFSLQEIVASHRKKFNIPIIGITGSNGKTIVKEWLNQLLEPEENICRSPKSYNSQIGVPLSVWQLNNEHSLGIFEAGISEKNEMSALQKIILPTEGILTNIGDVHQEGFENKYQKLNEKLILFNDAKKIIYCNNNIEVDNEIKSFIENKDCTLISWGYHNYSTYKIEIEKNNVDSKIIIEHPQIKNTILIPFTDDASIENCVHCMVYLLEKKYDVLLIQERVLQLHKIAMRLEIVQGIGHSTIINDSYSNDFASLSIALDFLEQQNKFQKNTIILSDFLQKTDNDSIYKKTISLLKEKKIFRFIGIGKKMSSLKNEFEKLSIENLYFFENTSAFLNQFNFNEIDQEFILVKGARNFEFEKIVFRLEEQIHQTVLEINLQHVIENLYVFKRNILPKTKIMAMVKAFSYGSGIAEIANTLQFQGIDYLSVAYTDEGVALRNAGINLPIMVLQPEDNSFEILNRYKLEPEIYSIRILKKLIEYQEIYSFKNIKIHLKLDTGMHRVGFEENDIEELILLLKKNSSLEVASIFSHLAASDEKNLDDFTTYQAVLFEKMATKIETELQIKPLKHLCNSSGIIRHKKYHYDMVRLGIGLYGIDTSSELKNELKEIGVLKTKISQIKKISSDETVGYSRKGILKKDSLIATVMIGYADGLSRKLGNGNGKMLIQNTLVPIIGNVCMDMCMLDISELKNVKEGDEVIVFGNELSINKLAEWRNTIPYEILTSISQRVKRVYFNE